MYLFSTFYLSIQGPPRTLDPSSKLCPLVEEGIEMTGRRLLDSVLDSGIFVVGGALLVVVVGAILVLGPTAIERWF
jgi:hypothetical protein